LVSKAEEKEIDGIPPTTNQKRVFWGGRKKTYRGNLSFRAVPHIFFLRLAKWLSQGQGGC